MTSTCHRAIQTRRARPGSEVASTSTSPRTASTACAGSLVRSARSMGTRESTKPNARSDPTEQRSRCTRCKMSRAVPRTDRLTSTRTNSRAASTRRPSRRTSKGTPSAVTERRIVRRRSTAPLGAARRRHDAAPSSVWFTMRAHRANASRSTAVSGAATDDTGWARRRFDREPAALLRRCRTARASSRSASGAASGKATTTSAPGARSSVSAGGRRASP